MSSSGATPNTLTAGLSGIENTGGGGGGGGGYTGDTAYDSTGGAGGSGIVIVRYLKSAVGG